MLANISNTIANMSTLNRFAGIGIILCLMVFLVLLNSMGSKNDDKIGKTLRSTKKKRKRRWGYSLYVFYSTVPILRRYFRKTANRLRIIYPADHMTINLKATDMITQGVVLIFIVVVLTIFAADGDVFFLMAGIVMTYVLFTTFVENSLERLERKLLEQLRHFIDQIREQYNRLGRIDDAVGYTLDGLPYEIGLHATRLHQILTSTRVEDEADKYVDEAPNKFLMTLAAIMATTMEYGDTKLENGQSLFLKNLNFLKEEVNMESIRSRKNDTLFSGLTYISLIPIVSVKPIELWAIKNMPDLAVYYKGAYGIVSMAIVFAASALSYTIIRSLKSATEGTAKETSIFKTLSEIPIFKRFLNVQISKNYTKAMRHNDMLKLVGDKLGVNAFLMRRYVMGGLTTVIVFLILTSSVVQGRFMELHDFAEAFDSSAIDNDGVRNTMMVVAEDYTVALRNTGIENNDELIEDIIKNTEITNPDQAAMIAKVVSERISTYNETYFKWFYLFGVFGSAIIGFYIPLWILMFQTNAVQMSMEDEISQFQTISVILMNVGGCDTIMILEWMERFARCFKDSITRCIIDIPHKGAKAIINMQNSESFQGFKSFCNNLLSIDTVGVREAFSNIETDREYYKEKRREDNEDQMRKKARWGQLAAIFPLVLVFIIYLIYPMLAMSMNMMKQVNGIM